MANIKRWTPEDSQELYNIPGWGQGYFLVGANGHLMVHPNRHPAHSISLLDLVEDAQAKGLALPLLIRFSDILHDRQNALRRAFEEACRTNGYQGGFQPVYPIKVNQQRQVVEEMVHYGTPHGMGLEAGSKPELHAALALQDTPQALIVCNGYKDAEYIRLALLAQKLGKRVFLVVEKLAELALILRLAAELEVEPLIGLRIKLVSIGSGKWEASGGDASKFGLTPAELVEAVALLRQQGQLHAFRLIHFHIGSQVTAIRRVKEALREMSRYYAELCKLGCQVDYVDVGGGLGVDYNGSRSAHACSTNYTEQEYANDIVFSLAEVCQREKLPHPAIISESGRAMTAHHALLVVNVFETASLAPENGNRTPALSQPEGGEPLPEVILKLDATLRELSPKNLMEFWHDALELREETSRLFDLGFLSLAHRAQAETLFWAIARRVEHLMRAERQPPDELEALEILLADKYFCNFSVFQSLPDAWAIGQQFPIVPLHRLNEKPGRLGILHDITCDSDGKIDNFISPRGRQQTLPLHSLVPGQPYYLGVFLTGAYQEILGDLHNLFGDTNAVHVAMNPDGGWRYEQIIQGETVADVLDYVNFRPQDLEQTLGAMIDRRVAEKAMTPAQGETLRQVYRAGLASYTYLQGNAKG